ncbi:bifunctional ADP-dependent NAD(P)H-hydrate dehydratase/NAD(P)H-hydrate epimerase [Malaciobacter molluscorum LMG 25693]|uniref:NAD(P)H-hydrate epimerase n=1 Tax=Malaciobacter molluscorum LMG 25693 TaxID=870501 RepID=A0A2G1DF16_9BACT|nr:NAD(P)H-hydrate dehydratase [Malaciobacter molluscorum]AXX91250.1 carbohydrate kinase, YjeF-related protein [Malaciobacter molluscorum LMG 25693]PHO17073.1 bifunctional ADP-dependent NAD(P)H-hydrate dehydratase/NAD(P)H-hydrate epimerase [Malaciobacter molluscorum LMG 25693]
MKKVFNEVSSLDKKCYEKYLLSEEILMEHAALSLKNEIEKKVKNHNSNILIVCGVGNNGADGITLSRLLQNRYKNIILYLPFGVKSNMAKIQLSRVNTLKIKQIDTIEDIKDIDLVVDCLFGSGLNKPLNNEAKKIIENLNSINAKKISCDIPSGINSEGYIYDIAFKADTTITMGALKISLFSDIAKEYIGKLKVGNLGISDELYEEKTNIYFLEKSDLQLPLRKEINSHKGTFGHACVVIGSKKGAGILASDAAFNFGAGLVTAMVHEEIQMPYYIMQSHNIPENTTAIAMGMGLGLYDKIEIRKILDLKIKKVIDADLFYDEIILDYLDENLVLTPHPKEFCALLKLIGIANIDVNDLQKNRIKYVKEFSNKYPKTTLLLKGANVLISQNQKIYINTFGTTSLSKGGSGDILSGLIVSLLAQGYSCKDSAINASLAHTLVAKKYRYNNYSLTPNDLIKGIKNI